MTIGKVAERAGVNIDTLRYYEREDVIGKPSRNGSNYRLYPEDTIRQVRFVKRAQELGFSLTEIKELLELRLKRNANCADVRDQALAKVDALNDKIRTLQAMRRALVKLANECSIDGPVGECPILDALDAKGRVR
ncbi:MAG: heavy metal-responsive transcriptional regulator [Bryobacterales bacterium]|nr:heavy metal-responsive transcriptional regulator [Bryobacterales bacterium]